MITDTTDLLAKVKRAAGKHTLADLKACAIRESKQRRIAYPGMIYRGKLNAPTAEIEQSRMAAIEAVLEVLCNADPQGAGRLI